jgi:hypothetical protein
VQHTDRGLQLLPQTGTQEVKGGVLIGIGGMVCGRKIERVNQCYKCYDHPKAKKMREAKKAARPKCSIYGCGGNELDRTDCALNIIGKALKTLKQK